MSDDEYADLDKRDKAKRTHKFDDEGSDKDTREQKRMQNKLKQKQNKEKTKKKDDLDINQFISGGAAPPKEDVKAHAESDEEDTGKKGKKGKRGAKQAKKDKKRNKKHQYEEDEGDKEHEEDHPEEEEKVAKHEGDATEETKEDTHEEAKEETKGEGEGEDEHFERNPDWPKHVYYCQFCTVPPEYCAFISQDIESCKEKLKEEDSHLYGIVYEGREEEVQAENKGKKKKNKNKPTFKEFSKSTEVKVVKLQRGGKKMVTQVNGLDGFGLNLKEFSKKLGKKFACGNSVVHDEVLGENVVQLLGDVDEEDFIMAIKNDFPDVAKAKIVFAAGGNQKGRKKDKGDKKGGEKKGEKGEKREKN